MDIIERYGEVRPCDLRADLRISTAAVHRQLKKLCERGAIERLGAPPRVFYRLMDSKPNVHQDEINTSDRNFLQEHYLYVTPTGRMLYGVEGLFQWYKDKKQRMKFTDLVAEYITNRREAGTLVGSRGVDAMGRMRDIFPRTPLDALFYADFYSLPKYGRTKLGQLVLYGKQAQNKDIINSLVQKCRPLIDRICRRYRIGHLGWIPHSLPRSTPFLGEFERKLASPLPKIEIVKAYTGDVPVAQKTLGGLEERIANAKTIVVVARSVAHENVLLIDDAVGSGATLNEAAKKLKKKGAKTVVGFAVVGSYKGFEVVREV